MNTTEDPFTNHIQISIPGETSKKSIITVKLFDEKTILEISAFSKTPLDEIINEIIKFSGSMPFIIEENRRELAKIVLFPRLTLLCFKVSDPVFYPLLFRVAFENKVKNFAYGFRADKTVKDVKIWISQRIGIQSNDFELINNWRLMKSDGILNTEMVMDNGHVECYLRGNRATQDSNVNVVTQDGMIYSFCTATTPDINSELSKIINLPLESFKIILNGKVCENFEGLDKQILFLQLTNKSFRLNFKLSKEFQMKFEPDDLIEYVRQTIKFLTLIPYNQIALISNKKSLEDNRKISDYSIQEDADIYIVLRQGNAHTAP